MKNSIFIIAFLLFSISIDARQRKVTRTGRSHVEIVPEHCYECDEFPQREMPREVPIQFDDVMYGSETTRNVKVIDRTKTIYYHVGEVEEYHVYQNSGNVVRYVPSTNGLFHNPTGMNRREPTWTINFSIGSTEYNNDGITNINNVVEYFKRNGGNFKVLVLGYADSRTGSFNRNYRLSELRADKVAEDLAYLGIPSNLIFATYNGDMIQPYPWENDLNRCVIVKIVCL